MYICIWQFLTYFLSSCMLKGFSSHRITSMIQFLSSVCANLFPMPGLAFSIWNYLLGQPEYFNWDVKIRMKKIECSCVPWIFHLSINIKASKLPAVMCPTHVQEDEDNGRSMVQVHQQRFSGWRTHPGDPSSCRDFRRGNGGSQLSVCLQQKHSFWIPVQNPIASECDLPWLYIQSPMCY